MLQSLAKKQLSELFADGLSVSKQYVIAHFRAFTNGYIVFLMLALATFLYAMPIGTGDTDLWFHMNGGRYFWEFGHFPDKAFYSFFDPDRTWTNYFWGFQLTAYKIHEYLGYEGLIALRTLLVCAALVVISGILIRADDTPRQRAWALVLLALAAFVVSGRTDEIRPHLFSYFMIPLFIYILEKRRAWLPALPFLTVIWINIHGIEWPVGATVCGAYFLEALTKKFSESSDDDGNSRTMLWTLLCLPVMLLNPNHYNIFLAPFNTPSEAYQYIAELQTNSILTLFTVSLAGPLLSLQSAVAMLNWGNIFAFTHLFLHRQLRLAPAIMAVAAIFLMMRGKRFVWEWLLLSLPLWRLAIDSLHHQAITQHPAKGTNHVGIANILMLVVVVSPAVSWSLLATKVYEWPIDATRLPTGTAEFIARQKIEGRLASSPNPGGYYAWKLYPEVLIASDMQIPPMTSWDHFRSIALLRNDVALDKLLREFEPNLIAAEKEYKRFAKLIAKHEAFRPVFFDDQYVLYADQTKLPEVVGKFELKHVNPYNLADESTGTPDERLAELQRIKNVDPNGNRVQHAIAWLLFNEKKFEKALPVALRFAESRPGDTNGHYLVGNILENLDRCSEAKEHYLRSLEVAPSSFVAEINKHLGTCAYLQQEFSDAFDYFDKSMAYYSKNEEPETMYQFALSAVAIGKEDKAKILLKQLLYSLPKEKEHIKVRATQLLNDLQ